MRTRIPRLEIVSRRCAIWLLAAVIIESATLGLAGDPTVLVTSAGATLSLALSPDGKMLAVASGTDDPERGTLVLWDLSTRRILRSLGEQTASVATLAFLPDGRQLAATSRVPYDPIVRIWDTRDGHLQRTLDRHADAVEGVAFSPDGKQMATSSFDGTVRLWSLEDGEEQQILEADRLAKLGPPSISPDGMLVAVDTVTRQAIVWDLASGQRRASYPATRDFALFSPGGRILALLSGEHAIKLLESRTGKPVWLLKGHEEPIDYVAFSGDGNLMVSADATSIRLWDVPRSKLVRNLKSDDRKIAAVALSSRGRNLAAADSRGQIRLWNVADLPAR